MVSIVYQLVNVADHPVTKFVYQLVNVADHPVTKFVER